MAWTIDYSQPIPGQIVDVTTGSLHVTCAINVDDGKTPVVKCFLYGQGITPAANPPTDAGDLYPDNGSGNGPYDCSGYVTIEGNTSGGNTKTTLTRLTLRVWAGSDNGGQFVTKKSRDQILWGFLPAS